MVSDTDLLNMSTEDLAKEIEVHQKRTALLFQTMASRISKKTNGDGFMKDENVNVAEYWYNVGLNYPKIIAADYSMPDFGEKIIFFNSVVSVNTQDEQVGRELKGARDIVSKDCAAYVSYIRKQVQDRQSDPVFKLILQKEPNPRKSKPTPPTPPTPPKTT